MIENIVNVNLESLLQIVTLTGTVLTAVVGVFIVKVAASNNL